MGAPASDDRTADEQAVLRVRLDEGDWRALLDPLLPLALLADPGDWWQQVSDECGLRLLVVIASALPPLDRMAALEDWRRELVPGLRPPRGWDQVRREVTQRERWAITLALDLLLVSPGVSVGVLPAQRRLARWLVARLPADRAPAIDDAIAALGVLSQWAVA